MPLNYGRSTLLSSPDLSLVMSKLIILLSAIKYFIILLFGFLRILPFLVAISIYMLSTIDATFIISKLAIIDGYILKVLQVKDRYKERL